MADQAPKNMPAANVRPNHATMGDADAILDPESLDKNYHYRFVQERPQRLARMRSKGYQFVSASEDGVKTIYEEAETPDDRIRNGDTVLMKLPKQEHQERRKKQNQLTRARLAAPKASFKKKARQNKVDVDDSDKE